jgi:hypothetical protein
MTDDRSPPPEPEACLVRRYPSSQKGGTLIAAGVVDLATHEAGLRAPDRYRPPGCGRCGAPVHIHDYRPRRLARTTAVATEVVRFRCWDAACGATWQVLPAFMARHLHHPWRVVEGAVREEEALPPSVPAPTTARWRRRLASSARLLVAVLAGACTAVLDAIIGAVGLDGTRQTLVHAYAHGLGGVRGGGLALLAELLHRLAPGVRLM